MKYLKYPVLIIFAGTCTGLFFYVRSLHPLRSFAASAVDSALLWTFAPLATLAKYVLAANLGLLAFWLLYSWCIARLAGERLADTLKIDAYTYLPLGLLALVLSQFNAFLTNYLEGFLLLAASLDNLLLIGALLGVFALKVRQFPGLGVQKFIFATGQRPALPGWRCNLLILLISFGLYFLVGMRTTTLEPGGDEPHYLLIAYSLLHDHDLAISNNYERRDYQSFHTGDLDKHVSIGKDGARYSIHPIGLPVLLLPAFALNGRQGAVVFMNFAAALLALQLYLLALTLTQNKRLALLLWFIASFTTPLLFYSSHLYPEMPLALLSLTAYRIITSPKAAKLATALILGCALAYLPWLHSRMILPAVILLLYHLVKVRRPTPPPSRRGEPIPAPSQEGMMFRKTRWTARQVWLALIPVFFLACSGLLMAGFFYTLYGNPLPTASYASTGRVEVFSLSIFLQKGFLGLLLDQEAGLLTFAPYYLFLFPGLLLLIRRQISQAVWLLILIGSIYLPCGGFTNDWQGGWSPAARYMVDLLPLFWTPFCLGAQSISRRRLFRYTFAFLAIIAFYWSYLFLQNPLSAIMRGVGRNPVLEDYSRVVDLTRYFPSFLVITPSTYVMAGMWLLVIGAFSVSVYRSAGSTGSPRTATAPFALSLSQSGRRMVTEDEIVTQLKTVWWSYGSIVAGLLVFTTIAEHTAGNPDGPQLNRNRQLHAVLADFEYATAVKTQMLRQPPLAPEDFRFTYGHRAKEAKVRKEGPRPKVSGLHREKLEKAYQQGARILVSGPYESFPKGKYTAYFNVLAADNTVSDGVVTIETSTRRGKLLFNQKTLQGTDFTTAGAYQIFPLPFELKEDVTNLETRVYFHNRVDISVENIAIQPDLAEFYYLAGLSALRQGQTDAAQTMLRRALAVAVHPQAAYQLAVMEQAAGNWEASRELLQNAVAQEPNFADAHYRLGLALKQTGQLDRAREPLAQTTQLLPTHLAAWQALQDLDRQLQLNDQLKTDAQRLQNLYQPQYPYAVNFGHQLMFLGYTVQNPTPGKLRVEYYWQALLPMARDYVLFVHFTGPGAKFQQDHDPHRYDSVTGQSAYYPTSRWQVGELVKEVFEIPAPAGIFEVELGVWDTKQRLPIIGADHARLFWQSEKFRLHPVTIQ